jgi:hypothetical protein
LTQNVSWRWCKSRKPGAGLSLTRTGFYINLPPSGVVICALSVLAVPEQVPKKPVRANWRNIITHELDLLGFALFAPAIIMLLLALIWGGNDYDWDSSVIIGLFCGAFANSLVFGAWELYRGDKAMIPPRLAKHKLVLFGGLLLFLQVGTLLLLSYYLPLWFQVVKDDSPILSGVDILPSALSQAIAGIVAGKLGECSLADIGTKQLRYCSPDERVHHTMGPCGQHPHMRGVGFDDYVQGQ